MAINLAKITRLEAAMLKVAAENLRIITANGQRYGLNRWTVQPDRKGHLVFHQGAEA